MSGLTWRWIFWVNVPIGVAVLAAGLTRLARSPKVSARIDLAGMLLGAFAVGAIAYAIQEGPTVGWTSAQVLTAGIGGLVLAGATMAWERRCAYPMVPPGLLANRSFAAAAASRSRRSQEPGRATGEPLCIQGGRLTPRPPALRASHSRACHPPYDRCSLSRAAAISRERAAGSRTGRSPAAQRRPQGVLDAATREPIITRSGKGGPAPPLDFETKRCSLGMAVPASSGVPIASPKS